MPVDSFPATGFVRVPAVLAVVPFSRSKLYVEVKAGRFPRQVQLSKRIAAWRAEEVRAWIDAQSQSSQAAS